MPSPLIHPFPGALTMWSYEPSRPRPAIVFRRWWARLKRQASPAWTALVPATPNARWLVLFLYTATGELSDDQRFTLERLRQEDAALLVICACPENHALLAELRDSCDALYWKAQDGWDFSAYVIALTELARRSPGADVLVMNDSVLGPYKPLIPFMTAAPWRLTAFTANALEENHVQSYAFIIKAVDEQMLHALSPVLSTEWSYNAADPVILWQETRFARVAHQHMSVGAFFYADGSRYDDLCLRCPGLLLEAGFPFLKRSLFGKFASVFQDPQEMQRLRAKLHEQMQST